MSSPKIEIDLKEGLHALPATKLAGGVRVKPHKHHSNERARSNSESSDVEETSGSPKNNPNPVIAGRQTKGDKDFTSDALKSFHEKPMKTSNEFMNGSKKKVIQQPKKF